MIRSILVILMILGSLIPCFSKTVVICRDSSNQDFANIADLQIQNSHYEDIENYRIEVNGQTDNVFVDGLNVNRDFVTFYQEPIENLNGEIFDFTDLGTVLYLKFDPTSNYSGQTMELNLNVYVDVCDGLFGWFCDEELLLSKTFYIMILEQPCSEVNNMSLIYEKGMENVNCDSVSFTFQSEVDYSRIRARINSLCSNAHAIVYAPDARASYLTNPSIGDDLFGEPRLIEIYPILINADNTDGVIDSETFGSSLILSVLIYLRHLSGMNFVIKNQTSVSLTDSVPANVDKIYNALSDYLIDDIINEDGDDRHSICLVKMDYSFTPFQIIRPNIHKPGSIDFNVIDISSYETTMAHEMGHSFGLKHLDLNTNYCKGKVGFNGDQNIMNDGSAVGRAYFDLWQINKMNGINCDVIGCFCNSNNILPYTNEDI